VSSFIKDVFRVGLSNFLIIVSGLGTSMLTARYLGPEKNGIIAAILVYPSLFMSVGSLGIRQSTTYFLGKGLYSETQIKRAITQIWFLTSFSCFFTCFILVYYFSSSGNNILWALLALIPIPFTLFNTYNSGIFLGKNDIKTFNKINWIPSLITFLGTFFFIVFFKFDISGYFCALILGPIFISFLLLFKNEFIKAFSLKFDWSIIKSMLSLGIVYAISLMIINLNYRIDTIILDKLSNTYELGLYSKGAGLSQYLWQIPMLLSTVVFARSATAKNDFSFSLKITQLLRLSLLIVGVLSLILFIFGRCIIFILYGYAFEGSIIVFQILLPGVIILTLFKTMNMDLAGKGKPWVSVKAMLPALIVNIVINVILIPKFGAKGAAISSTISYSVGGILFLYFYSREIGIPITQILKFSISDLDVIKYLFKKLSNNHARLPKI